MPIGFQHVGGVDARRSTVGFTIDTPAHNPPQPVVGAIFMAAAQQPSLVNPAQDTRPGLAILAVNIPPYRVHLHRLIAAGIPELKLHTLVSHGTYDFNWNVSLPAEINVVQFGAANESPVESTFRRPWSEWRKGAKFIRYLQDHNIRAVICSGYRHISYLRVIRFCHQADIPVFVNNDSNIRVDQLPSSPVKRLLKKRIYAWWTKRVSGVMSMGTLGDQFFLKYGANPRHLYRVPCWPDFALLARVDEVGLARFRQRFGLSPLRRYLIFSGRLVQLKRVDLLIDAFATIASKRPDWDLLIVGDGVLRDQLQRRVPDALRSRVIWTGFLDGDEPALAYHAADVLVLPSEKEAWSLVVQEAMAAGLVVVSSDVPGAPYDMIQDGYSGRIFPSGDLAELQRALLQVTDVNALPRFQDRSRTALEQWKERSHPVAEIRRALADFGVLDGSQPGAGQSTSQR